jgi:hypothetical protein
MYSIVGIVDGGVRCGGVAVGAFERALERVTIPNSFAGW